MTSSAGWLWFAAQHGHWAMFWQQVGFTAFSLVGVWQWLLVPRRMAHNGQPRQRGQVPPKPAPPPKF